MADSTTNIPQIEASQAQKEVTANALFDAASVAMYGGKNQDTTAGLVWGLILGRWGGTENANDTITLEASEDNYIVIDRVTGEPLLDTPSDDLWSDVENYAHLYKVVTGASSVTSYEDHRAGPSGLYDVSAALGAIDADDVTYTPTTLADWTGSDDPGDVEQALDQLAERVSDVEGASFQPLDSDLTTIAALTATTDNFMQSKSSAWASRTVAQVTTDLQGTGSSSSSAGFRGLPVNSQSGNYTTVMSDNGKTVRHPFGAGAGDTFTIDSQANVTWPDGAAITFENRDSNSLSIAITTDTLRWADGGGTGTRALAQYGVATAIFDDAINEWLLSGIGLS